MFVDLDWPLNASSLLSASAELLVSSNRRGNRQTMRTCSSVITKHLSVLSRSQKMTSSAKGAALRYPKSCRSRISTALQNKPEQWQSCLSPVSSASLLLLLLLWAVIQSAKRSRCERCIRSQITGRMRHLDLMYLPTGSLFFFHLKFIYAIICVRIQNINMHSCLKLKALGNYTF